MQEQFRAAGFDLTHPRIAKYLELSIRMLDLPRHLGQHSGGMIIAQGQLASVVPIEPASMPGRNVIQWDKEDVSDMGLIKVDLLGLGMMAVLKDCTNLIPQGVHRRDALWQVQRAGRQAGPLLEALDQDEDQASPLQAMNPEERMVADYAGTGVTVGHHPMAHCREQLRAMNVCRAADLRMLRHGVKAKIAGCVIARQRPGTAHGFIFLSIEDETGISNAIIEPELYERNRSLVTYARFLLIEGILQNVDKVIHIRARHLQTLDVTAAPTQSHDFH